MTRKIVVKLGGSLITEKNRPYTPRTKIIERLAEEIRKAMNRDAHPIIIHGGGSFGHVEAHKAIEKYGILTDESVPKITNAMNKLNQIIINKLIDKEIPAVSFPPHAFCIKKCSQNNNRFECNYKWFITSYMKGGVPVAFGDIIYGETKCHPSILSGDDIALETAHLIEAEKIVFAMDVKGILKNPKEPENIYHTIKLEEIPRIIESLHDPQSTIDVTQGIKGKLNKIYKFYKEKTKRPQIIMLSGLEKEYLYKALIDEPEVATRII